MTVILGKEVEPVLASAPGSPVVGQRYFDSTLGTSRVWTGTQWQSGVSGDGLYTTTVGNTLTLLGSSAVPAAPSNGAVTNPSGTTDGGTRKGIGAFTSDGAKLQYTITHGLATLAVEVRGYENNAGAPGIPRELNWAPSTANAITINMPPANIPVAGTTFFVTILG